MQSPCLTPQLRRALLAQVCCGIPELCNFLDNEIDFLWKCQHNCTDRLKYIYTQLGLIEAAQIYSRNKIDTMIQNAESNTQERYTAFNNTRTDAERDSSGKACHWAASTSQQFFNRDSTDNSVGFSDYRLQYTSEFKNNGYDKSCRHTTGHGFHMSRIETFHNRDRGDFRFHSSTDFSITNGGTSNFVPPKGYVAIGAGFNGSPDLDPIPFVNEPDISPTYSSFSFPDGTWSGPNGRNGICPNPIDGDLFCTQRELPSMGQGFNFRYQFAFTTATLGTINITVQQGENERQYYHCTTSNSDSFRSDTSSVNDRTTGSTDASEKDNQTYNSEQTDIFHLVRKYGITIRRGTTDLDAEDKAHGRSDGIAHSESNRNNQGSAHQTSRSEAETVKHSENHLRKTETANDDTVSNKYGQISVHLSKLWDRVWQQYLQLERQLVAVPLANSMDCNLKGDICCPVRVSYADLKLAHSHVIH